MTQTFNSFLQQVGFVTNGGAITTANFASEDVFPSSSLKIKSNRQDKTVTITVIPQSNYRSDAKKIELVYTEASIKMLKLGYTQIDVTNSAALEKGIALFAGVAKYFFAEANDQLKQKLTSFAPLPKHNAQSEALLWQNFFAAVDENFDHSGVLRGDAKINLDHSAVYKKGFVKFTKDGLNFN